MAQIVCIRDRTHHPAVNDIGDIVCVYGDEHMFDPNEREMFEIVCMPGVAPGEIAELLPQNSANAPTNGSERKYKYNLSGLSKSDRQKLEEAQLPKAERLSILGKIKNKAQDPKGAM